ncbi:EAL domain-containing protein [Bacillus tuaregi]|uniref:EAL domain-containing protein n=1 Tax=Bacillus tuaregi TaxID=1816695 RepID=UPI0008F90517|nr:EAL domain-containing protein [Bacillus tuaregi]
MDRKSEDYKGYARATELPNLIDELKTEWLKLEKELKQVSEQLRLNEMRFKTVIQRTYDVNMLLTHEGVIKHYSLNDEAAAGGPFYRLQGRNLFDYLHQDDREKAKEIFIRLENKSDASEKAVLRIIDDDDGAYIHCEMLFMNFLTDPDFQGIAVYIKDITQNRLALEKLFDISNHDFLTRLPNKPFFESLVSKELYLTENKGGTFALMVIQLHGLEFVNETLTQSIGDLLLKEASKRLQEFVKNKGIVARFEGVYFPILLPQMRNGTVGQMATDLISLFEQPFIIQGYELSLTVNLGISLYPESGGTVHTIIRNAYSALHHANETGPNTYEVYSSNMNIKTYKRFSLFHDLQMALKNQEFLVYFQPRVEAKTHRIIAAEALIRWEHPKWGMVSPNEFIPLAEKSGLIGSLGEFVLNRACQHVKEWQEKGLEPVKVSVNFSILQFLQRDVIQMVEDVLKQTSLEAKWLEIEITESVLMENEAVILDKISKLSRMGISIAIDDFGTGYSSLSYLRKLKADIIKIDRSFIKGIPDDRDSIDIVAAILQLAKKFKMRIVAEGVDSSEQLATLKRLKCDEIQGYLFSKPLRVDQFELLLKEGICHPEQILHADSVENRREHLRIKLTYPLSGEMTITEMGGEEVSLGATGIRILDISPGGLRMETVEKLPVRSDMILRFSTTLLGTKLDQYGKVVWRKELDDDRQCYGIRFIRREK